jgi:fructokinase
MSHIYTIGETVYDLIFKENKPVSGTPGGAMLNSSVTLGRIGLPVHFISEIGKDKMGDLILSFLNENNINTDQVRREKTIKTALAIAFLDKFQNATYDFYKYYPQQDYTITIPNFKAGDFFLFGSFFALSERYLSSIRLLISAARKVGSIVLYDPNFRKAHLHELEELKPIIIDNIKSADIVRGSDEDFESIFGMSNPIKVWEQFGDEEKVLIYTQSHKGVTVVTNQIRNHYQAHKIKPVSTIGAGDNFNAGIVYSMYDKNLSRKDISLLDTHTWDEIISMGIKFGTQACLTMENYLSKADIDTLSYH